MTTLCFAFIPIKPFNKYFITVPGFRPGNNLGFRSFSCFLYYFSSAWCFHFYQSVFGFYAGVKYILADEQVQPSVETAPQVACVPSLTSIGAEWKWALSIKCAASADMITNRSFLMTFEKCLGLCWGIEGKLPFYSTEHCSPCGESSTSKSEWIHAECMYVHLCHWAAGRPQGTARGLLNGF